MAEKAVLASRPRNLIPYTTQNELQFVKGIGSHVRDKSFYFDRSRLEILRSYRRSLDKREVWGDIEKEIILRFVEGEIEKEKLNNDYDYDPTRKY